MITGIYKILNKVNGKFYIGSAAHIEKRWREHKHYLRNNTHKNEHLQFAWNKYGEENFEFIVIQICIFDELLKSEQTWIDETECCDKTKGYNILAIAANSFGYIHTMENKVKMRQAQLGSQQSEETINLKAAANRKLDKWPCVDGSRCRCHVCNFKKSEYSVKWIKNKKLKESVFS